MTEHDLDDLASDLLDGLLTDEQAADALHDPAVARRVDEMRAAQAQLRGLPAVDPHRRDSAIAAALRSSGSTAALDSAGTAWAASAAGAAGEPGSGDELAIRRNRRARHGAGRRSVAPWMAAAAVLVVALGVGSAIAVTSRDSTDDVAGAPSAEDTSSGAASESADNGGGSDTGAAEGPAAAPTTTAPPAGGARAPTTPDADSSTARALTDLGKADSLDDLAARANDATVREDAAAQATLEDRNQVADALASGHCSAPPGATAKDGRTVELEATATLRGEPVDVWIVSGGGKRRMIVVDASCTVTHDRPLP